MDDPQFADGNLKMWKGREFEWLQKSLDQMDGEG